MNFKMQGKILKSNFWIKVEMFALTLSYKCLYIWQNQYNIVKLKNKFKLN